MENTSRSTKQTTKQTRAEIRAAAVERALNVGARHQFGAVKAYAEDGEISVLFLDHPAAFHYSMSLTAPQIAEQAAADVIALGQAQTLEAMRAAEAAKHQDFCVAIAARAYVQNISEYGQTCTEEEATAAGLEYILTETHSCNCLSEEQAELLPCIALDDFEAYIIEGTFTRDQRSPEYRRRAARDAELEIQYAAEDAAREAALCTFSTEHYAAGCSHSETGSPFYVSLAEAGRNDFASFGWMQECSNCGATRYLTDEESEQAELLSRVSEDDVQEYLLRGDFTLEQWQQEITRRAEDAEAAEARAALERQQEIAHKYAAPVSDVYSDTMSQARYLLIADGAELTISTRYGIALEVAALLDSIDALYVHQGSIAAVIAKLDAGDNSPTQVASFSVSVSFHSN